MPNEFSEGYLLLFNTISRLIEDVRILQVFLMAVNQSYENFCSTEPTEDCIEVLNIRRSAIRWLICKLQQAQVDMVLAQQKAEDFYIESGEQYSNNQI